VVTLSIEVRRTAPLNVRHLKDSQLVKVTKNSAPSSNTN
jgi:hypothetical protein